MSKRISFAFRLTLLLFIFSVILFITLLLIYERRNSIKISDLQSTNSDINSSAIVYATSASSEISELESILSTNGTREAEQSAHIKAVESELNYTNLLLATSTNLVHILDTNLATSVAELENERATPMPRLTCEDVSIMEDTSNETNESCSYKIHSALQPYQQVYRSTSDSDPLFRQAFVIELIEGPDVCREITRLEPLALKSDYESRALSRYVDDTKTEATDPLRLSAMESHYYGRSIQLGSSIGTGVHYSCFQLYVGEDPVSAILETIINVLNKQ